jgi:hypothetical protein
MKTTKKTAVSPGWKQHGPAAKLTPAKRRVLLKRIDDRRNQIGPVGFSTTAIIRQMREGGLFMPGPSEKRQGKRRGGEVPLPKLRRPLRPDEKARFERTKAIRESFGKQTVPVGKLLREMRDE